MDSVPNDHEALGGSQAEHEARKGGEKDRNRKRLL